MSPVEIYSLSDPDTGEVRYLGKANNSAKRLKRHILDARRRRTPVYDWMNSLAARGKLPVITVVEVTDQDGWPAAERRHIAEARARGVRLLNLAEGGNQPECSDEVRSRNGIALNARLKADPRLSRIREDKRRIAVALKRNEVANRTRAKLREAARLAPRLFGEWLSIPDREENPDGSPLARY